MNGIYARQSLDKKDSLSIDMQIELCEKEIQNEEYIKYLDKGYSGKDTNRPRFQEMMADVRSGKLDKIIIYKLDRLSRSLLDFAAMMTVFNQYGVTFVSAREKFDTSTPIGNAMLSIIMVFAQLERETIQLRVRDAFHARSARGAYDGLAPYGYRKCKDVSSGKAICTIEPEPETAPILLSIFETYAYSDISLGRIAKQLNENGTPSPNGVKWDSCKLSRIMANPIYVRSDVDIYNYYRKLNTNITNSVDDFIGENGCVTYGQWDRKRRKFDQMNSISLSIGLHPGLVPSSVFLIVQEKLNANLQVNNAKAGKYSWLTGFIKCGYCKHALVVKSFAQGELRFSCSGRTNYGECTEYTNKRSILEVEDAVRKELFDALRSKQELFPKQQISDDYAAMKYKMELAKLDDMITRLVDAIAQGGGDGVQAITQRIAKLEKERDDIDARILGLQQISAQGCVELETLFSQWPNMTVLQKREIARSMINQIAVFNDKLQIIWKYDFSDK